MLNLLTCRIKRGIEVNRSAKLFLEMVRPALLKLAMHAIKGTRIELDVAIADLESKTMEYLQRNFVLGDRGYPLHYLFNIPKGAVCRYANTYTKDAHKYENGTVFVASGVLEEGTTEEEADDPLADLVRQAREVVDDGITLTLQEYRVLKFCLMNASDAKRPLNGLHVYLARAMNVIRARVTRVYADAREKVRFEVEQD